MGCRQLILFPAIFIDGQLQQCTDDVLVDCEKTHIIGEKTEKAWDAVKERFKHVTGFFISYKGLEYGSTAMNQSDFLAACQAACNEPVPVRIHDFMHAIEFD